MSKKDFKANEWLFHTQQNINDLNLDKSSNKALKTMLADFTSRKKNNAHTLNNFFVPGWEGNSLVSRHTTEFKKTIQVLHEDVKSNFSKISNLNTKLKIALYEEFLNFAEFKALNFTGINDHQDLWREIKNPNSQHEEKLKLFIEIYTFRICVIYILKIRFVAVFLKHSQQKFDFKKIFYPNSFLTSVFRKGSSTELNSNALAQNIFSWYRPDETLKDLLTNLFEISNELSITEIIKNISVLSEKITNKDSKYSHSLSHKNFGLFLNSLLINFPLWLSSTNPRFRSDMTTQDGEMDIISCRYIGDYLESMSLSHWIAQHSNKSIKWDQILCPTFKSPDFEAGLYVEVINELQFLTFLAQIANEQGKQPTNFICQVIQGNLKNRQQSNLIQKTLFNDIICESCYDRLIINITDHPKSNIQHFLMNQVSSNAKKLKDNGLIYLISSKKLFVPSQKDKLQHFLTNFNLEGLFNLEDVTGKGELGCYLYIFSKNLQYTDNQDSKKSFASFRVSGNLKTFQEFEKITQLTHTFFAANLNDSPPLAHKELGGFTLEFFKDAIVNGRMIHASTKDSSKVTHPKFFNNLMQSCSPFDYFFTVRAIKEDQKEVSNGSFGLRTQLINSSHVLIVDQRIKEQAHIELISQSSYEAKLEEYGRSKCSYFEITPKWPNCNIEALKVFLSSKIGIQLIDLTFNSQVKRTKANLGKLLVPNFIINYKSIPEHITEGISLLSLSSKQILELHPLELEKQFSIISNFLVDTDICTEYPSDILGRLSLFRKSLGICLELFELSNKRNVLNFNNPILKAPLLMSKTTAIYPNNEDVFVEFTVESDASLIHAPLEQLKVSQKEDSFALELYSNEEKIVSLFSDIEMIQFLEYILGNAKTVPISQILQGVKAPALADLKNIINAFNQMKLVLEKLSQDIDQISESFLNRIISRPKNSN